MREIAVVFRTHSDIEARLVKGLLEARGISSFISSDVPHSVFPVSIDGLGEVRISVPSDDAGEARRLIEGYTVDPAAKEGRPDDTKALEERLGYRFRDRDLLDRALTHRSRAHEEPSGDRADNESLEFLGDAVLGFLVADLLYREFPDFDEGRKSKLKAALVSTPALARLATAVDLGRYVKLGRGEEKTGGRRKQALLADSYEALIAAVYLDGGTQPVRSFIERELRPLLDQVHLPDFFGRDYKSSLQERLQAESRGLPEYRVAAESGPDHQKIFEVDLSVSGETIATATGRSKKEAEQEAARLALEKLSGKG
jgi:ribonuclease III